MKFDACIFQFSLQVVTIMRILHLHLLAFLSGSRAKLGEYLLECKMSENLKKTIQDLMVSTIFRTS